MPFQCLNCPFEVIVIQAEAVQATEIRSSNTCRWDASGNESKVFRVFTEECLLRGGLKEALTLPPNTLEEPIAKAIEGCLFLDEIDQTGINEVLKEFLCILTSGNRCCSFRIK